MCPAGEGRARESELALGGAGSQCANESTCAEDALSLSPSFMIAVVSLCCSVAPVRPETQVCDIQSSER